MQAPVVLLLNREPSAGCRVCPRGRVCSQPTRSWTSFALAVTDVGRFDWQRRGI